MDRPKLLRKLEKLRAIVSCPNVNPYIKEETEKKIKVLVNLYGGDSKESKGSKVQEKFIFTVSPKPATPKQEANVWENLYEGGTRVPYWQINLAKGLKSRCHVEHRRAKNGISCGAIWAYGSKSDINSLRNEFDQIVEAAERAYHIYSFDYREVHRNDHGKSVKSSFCNGFVYAKVGGKYEYTNYKAFIAGKKEGERC